MSERAAVAIVASAAVRSGRGMNPPIPASLTKSAPLLAGRWSQHRLLTFAAAHVDDLCRLADFQNVQRVGVVVNIRDRLAGNLDDDVAFLQTCLLGRSAADDAAQQQ